MLDTVVGENIFEVNIHARFTSFCQVISQGYFRFQYRRQKNSLQNFTKLHKNNVAGRKTANLNYPKVLIFDPNIVD